MVFVVEEWPQSCQYKDLMIIIEKAKQYSMVRVMLTPSHKHDNFLELYELFDVDAIKFSNGIALLHDSSRFPILFFSIFARTSIQVQNPLLCSAWAHFAFYHP